MAEKITEQEFETLVGHCHKLHAVENSLRVSIAVLEYHSETPTVKQLIETARAELDAASGSFNALTSFLSGIETVPA